VRLLVQDHADRVPRPWRRFPAARAARSYDAVAFTSREQAAPFFAAGLFAPELPVHEVLEGSTHFTAGDAVAARHALGIHGNPCLAWVGRLDDNKDPLTVLEGLARAVERFADPHLWMCFRAAPLRARVEERIRDDVRLRGRVHLMGPLPPERVELLLRGAEALLQGSWRESTGYGVIEALACGATPVVTDIPSFRVIVGGAGLLWARGDAASLAASLGELATRDRAALRQAALDQFAAALSWDAIGRQLVGTYAAVLGADAYRQAGGSPARGGSA
jgi:glycosyltransferase involved in cell wall biosynthesis